MAVVMSPVVSMIMIAIMIVPLIMTVIVGRRHCGPRATRCCCCVTIICYKKMLCSHSQAQCMQGADDHINRLQAQVQSLQANSAQAELNRVRAELAESENAVSQLQQQLEAQQAEVLRLKENQGGSNKAADVIQALEKQVWVNSNDVWQVLNEEMSMSRCHQTCGNAAVALGQAVLDLHTVL